MLMLLSFEMDLDLDVINRVGYNVIDMFSDIGGIQSILMTFFALILTVLNYNYFDSYMAQKLFKLEKKSARRSEQEEAEFLSPSRLANSKEFLIDVLPRKWVCCRK